MLLAFPLLWAAGAVAALFYAQDRGIPWATALAVLPAFLLEVSLYFTMGVERLRLRLEKLSPSGVATVLVIAALVPYALASLALRNFSWHSMGVIAALAVVAAFWYVVFPHQTAVDILFLIFIAAVWLARAIPPLYESPLAALPLGFLGQLMWFRTGIFAMLSVRRMKNVGFGFWPAAREWKIGALYFVGLAPVAAAAGWVLHFASPHLRYAGWERTTLIGLATFFGILWVVALGEEFFFRGLLQQWIAGWLRSDWAGLLLAALLFGSVHLWYRAFPNWRFAALAGVAGVFYGMAYRQARSIRASMVTHALTVTAWRLFFS
ncbi:MAG TPA: CPBP family glutamic-type intramembrane protease [Bryobacteraceae bacterium]|jgi:membrane protease YdiL (CAAX protease family)|nr:CPBP family glutamic-type intramembrane protease [Bryobacteraceae bacterium]